MIVNPQIELQSSMLIIQFDQPGIRFVALSVCMYVLKAQCQYRRDDQGRTTLGPSSQVRAKP